MFKGGWRLLYDLTGFLPVLVVSLLFYSSLYARFLIGFLIVVCIAFSLSLPKIADLGSFDNVDVVKISPNDSFYQSLLSNCLPLVVMVMDLPLSHFIVLLVLLIFLISVSTSIIPNPVLRMCGYHFYTVDVSSGLSGISVLSRSSSPLDVKTMQMGKLWEFTFIAR